MATRSQFGDPSHLYTVRSTPISETTVGYDGTLLLVAKGIPNSSADPNAGTGEPNKLYDIRTAADARRIFGQDSRMHIAVQEAFIQPTRARKVKAIMPTTLVAQGEDPTTNAGTLANAPIVEDRDAISATSGGTTPADLTIDWSYESPPADPATETDPTADRYVNPNTGEVGGAVSGDQFSYEYLDWDGALTSPAMDRAYEQLDVGTILLDTEADSVGQTASTVVNVLSGDVRLPNVVLGAQPNATLLDPDPQVTEPVPIIDIANYGDGIDNDRVFVAGPVRLRGNFTRRRSVLPGLAARMAGNRLTDPLFDDHLAGYGALAQPLSQSVTTALNPTDTGDERTEVQKFTDANLMALYDKRGPGSGNISVQGTSSSSTLTDFDRDLQKRKVIDSLISDLYPITADLKGERLVEALLNERRERIITLFQQYITDDLIHETVGGVAAGGFEEGQQGSDANAAGQEEEQEAYFAVLRQTGENEVSVALGVSIVGVAKVVLVDLAIGSQRAIVEESAEALPATVAGTSLT